VLDTIACTKAYYDMPKTHIKISMTLRVLGYLEDEAWVAHCLETDLVGRGKTFSTALKDLHELTEMQVSFAVFKDQRSLLDHPAPPEIWQMYERVTQEHLRTLQKSRTSSTNAVAGLPLPLEPKNHMAWCGA
jgi:hypothetical protein